MDQSFAAASRRHSTGTAALSYASVLTVGEVTSLDIRTLPARALTYNHCLIMCTMQPVQVLHTLNMQMGPIDVLPAQILCLISCSLTPGSSSNP